MSTRVTTIDHSGKYYRPDDYGWAEQRTDGRWNAYDPCGKLVTEIGAAVVFESQEAAEQFLRGRNPR